MTDGYTTGNGLGLGLSGSKRLVNDFDIYSRLAKVRESRSCGGNTDAQPCLGCDDDSSQVGEARRAAMDVASQAELSPVDAGKLSIITNELATNILKHARTARC